MSDYATDRLSKSIIDAAKIIAEALNPEALVEMKESSQEIVTAWANFRHNLRSLLNQYGVKSNPGWTENDIVEAFRDLIPAYCDQQYNKGLEDAACQAENKTKMLSCSHDDHGVPDAIRKLKREEK